MSPFSFNYLTILSINLWFSLSNSGCPLGKMTKHYNFSGDWSYNLSADNTEAYVMHICHFENHELYFTLAKNDTPQALIGFGSGNWSQINLMIGGKLFKINNGSTSSHGFGVGMNMELHQWWYQDPYLSSALDEGQKGLYPQTCAVPFGRDIRHVYWREFWDAKRKFHSMQRIEKRKRVGAKREKQKEEKKKAVYVKYYEQFLDYIGYGEEEEQHDPASDEIINAKFVYDKTPNFPTLFGETWINDDGLSVTFVDEENGCFNGELFSNISVAYYGVGINSFIEKYGIKNGQFFVQVDQDQLMGSSVTFKLNENGDIVEDQLQGFTMRKAETFVACNKGDSKSCDDASKCEL